VRRVLLFGKLPAHGDFLSSGLSLGERQELDGWMSDELSQARSAFGDGFEAAFDTAPPWRFAAAGPGGDWIAGAMAPSVDAAGRRFPVILAIAGLAGEQTVSAAMRCEDAIYGAFGGEQIDSVVERLSFTELDPGEAPGGDLWWCDGDEAGGKLRVEGSRPRGLLLDMLTIAGEAT
jgi:type VI secretion system protein ImpM